MPPVFELLARGWATSPAEEMRRTFNMGIGMIVCVPADRAAEATDAAGARGRDRSIAIGQVAAADAPDAPVEFLARMNVGVLVSGSGTNLQALIDARAARRAGAGAASSSWAPTCPDCAALARARAAGLPTFVVDHRDYPARGRLRSGAGGGGCARTQVELVVLAGFMRMLTAEFLRGLPRRG